MDGQQKSGGADLNSFLVNNPEFERLSAELRSFNIFEVLRVGEHEIRHSNVLAWLLNPDGSHTLGDLPLRRILSSVIHSNGERPILPSAAKIELMEFRGIEIRREWHNVDILAIDRVNRLILLIENKLNSKESKGQLERYLEDVRREFREFSIVPVFFTLLGEPVVDESVSAKYLIWSHAALLRVLETIYELMKGNLSPAVQVFLEQYLKTLRRLTMEDTDYISLCKSIYRKHKYAIDEIVKYGSESLLQMATTEAFKELNSFVTLSTTPSFVCFLPKSTYDVLPENGTAWFNFTKQVGVCCWFAEIRERQHLRLVFECSSMDDPVKRVALVQKLKEEGFTFTKLAERPEAKYSRFHRDLKRLNDPSDPEEMLNAVRTLLKGASERFTALHRACSAVFG